MIELHVVFHGLVQGVGFRRKVLQFAMQHHIVGAVRNLEDGLVEMIAQGPQEELTLLLDKICKYSDPARIEAIEKTWRPIQKSYQSFEILR